MNASRIEVPLALPEPHFEDEATVVTARQVVPIEQARHQERRRKLLVILPLLLAAAFCGGLGALAISYFEQRSPETLRPSNSGTTEERPTVAPVASPDNQTATSTDSKDQPDSAPTSGSALATDSPAADSLEKSGPAKSDESLASVKRPSSPTDPKQLGRLRRVHPPSGQPRLGQNDQSKSRGAARIQDIFSGPNP